MGIRQRGYPRTVEGGEFPQPELADAVGGAISFLLELSRRPKTPCFGCPPGIVGSKEEAVEAWQAGLVWRKVRRGERSDLTLLLRIESIYKGWKVLKG
jgi:hypothetical protein